MAGAQVGLSLYVGGGIGYAVRTEGATPALASHPHVDRWHALAGLVRDGCTWTQAEIARRREGGGGYSSIDEEARGGGGAEEQRQEQEQEQEDDDDDGEAGGESGDAGAST